MDGIENRMVYSSTNLDKLFTAFSQAQGEFAGVALNKRGHYGKYADLVSIYNSTRPSLSKHKLGVMQTVGEGKITTVLSHASGQHMVFETTFPHKANTGLASGGLWTLMRRYSLCAVLNIAGDEDAEAVSNAVDFEPDQNFEVNVKIQKMISDAEACKDMKQFLAFFTTNEFDYNQIKKRKHEGFENLKTTLQTIKTNLNKGVSK